MNPLKLFRAWRAWTALKRLLEEYTMTREPVMIGEIVRAAVTLLAVFGLQFSSEQVGAIAIVAGMIVGLIARAKVTPVEQ